MMNPVGGSYWFIIAIIRVQWAPGELEINKLIKNEKRETMGKTIVLPANKKEVGGNGGLLRNLLSCKILHIRGMAAQKEMDACLDL
jgi:hypothetical protein